MQGKFLPKHALVKLRTSLPRDGSRNGRTASRDRDSPGLHQDRRGRRPAHRSQPEAGPSGRARRIFKSGLTIACHTGDGAAAMEEMETAAARKASIPRRGFGCMLRTKRDRRAHERAASRGGWVEFDGVGPGNNRSAR